MLQLWILKHTVNRNVRTDFAKYCEYTLQLLWIYVLHMLICMYIWPFQLLVGSVGESYFYIAILRYSLKKVTNYVT